MIGESGGEDEAASLDTDNNVRTRGRHHLGETVNNSAKPGLVLKQRGDVVKQDAWLGEIRNLANQFLQIIHAQPLISKNVLRPSADAFSSITSETREKDGPRSNSARNLSRSSLSASPYASTSPFGRFRTQP